MEKRNLEIRHIKKVFQLENRELEALSDIDLTIDEGEFISIVGASGCGKSTLLRMLAGLEKPTEGEIWIHGKKVEKPSVEIGMIFQESRLFPWLSVEKNIEFGIHEKLPEEEKRSLIQRHVDLVGLHSFEKALPNQLSGGMQQRVSIARALINNPSVLLLDEPFGALDAFTRMTMQTELLNIWREEKNTMILVTHDIDEAIFLSTRIVIMSARPGKVEQVIKVELPKQRDRSSEDFMKIRRRILKAFFGDNETMLEYYI